MLDLRKLMLMIKEQKEMNANLSLEFDCDIETEDHKPLVKVINYILNYLSPLTDKAIEISLNQQMGKIVLNFSVFTEHTDLPVFSDQLDNALKIYNAQLEIKQQAGEYIQIMITFS